MIDLPDGPPTMRQRIMTVLLDRFSAQRRSENGAILTWDLVTDKTISAGGQQAGYVLGIYDTSETKKDNVQSIMCFLNVVMEFRIGLAEGDEPTTILRAVLGEVQRVATIDLNTKEPDGYQLTLDVKEKGNELENMSEQPTTVAGVVVFEVQYRHAPGKPWKR